MAQATTAVDREAQAYLPDFCAAGTLLVVVLVAALVAIVLTLAGNPESGTFLVQLAETSMFVLWLALLSAAVLCRARGWLESLGKTQAFVIGFLMLLAVCMLLAEAAYQVTGRFGQAIIPDTHAGFLLRTFAVGSIVIALAMRYLYVASEWRRSIVLEAQSRVSALQALIRPHFLFNSMNTIASLTRSDPRLAEQAVEDLADLLRANLGGPRDQSTLRDEVEIATIYERIEKLRLGDRLGIRWDLDDVPPLTLLPNLTLQPLIENAIYHGVELVPEGGEVVVTGRRQDGRIVIEISNPLAPAAPVIRAGNQMALSNIRQRFELKYGAQGQVVVRDTEESFIVRLELPFEEEVS